MKKIKVRAYLKSKIDGRYLKAEEEGCFLVSNGDGFYLYYEDTHELVKDYVVVQYIDIDDRRGVEIFDGDLVAYHQTYTGLKNPARNGIKKERIKKWCVKPFKIVEVKRINKEKHNKWNVSKGTNNTRLEVVGNIYENPELIKKNHG